MKIVSKYKDFYDFIVQDHDADLIYVRNIGLANIYLDDLFKRDNNYLPYYSKYYGYNDPYSKYYKHGSLGFGNFVFGIYPFVFSQPVLRIYYKYRASNSTESLFHILGKDLTDKILDSSVIVSKSAIEYELIPLAQKLLNEKVSTGLCGPVKVGFDERIDVKNYLRKFVWKVDCHEIFYKLESPIFVKYEYDLFVNGAYQDAWPENAKVGTEKTTHYVTDISFQKLNYNILKYWYNELFDINTYINIENFLWSIKQEPEAKPDNKTKILAHGFDLKTSFRKM